MKKFVRAFILAASLAILATAVPAQSMFRKVNDFDGDGKADFAVTALAGGLKTWYIWRTTAGYQEVQWGLSTDRTVAGDYDGDGKTDLAVRRDPTLQSPAPPILEFHTYILRSQTGTLDIKTITRPCCLGYGAAQQDYDGDGKTDPAVFIVEGGTFLTYLSSMTGTTAGASTPGLPVRIGDMTGDGRAEASTWNGSNGLLYMRNLATGVNVQFFWGTTGDEYVPGDFDGDGKGDITIFRPPTGDWWSFRSSDNVVNVAHWGMNGDTPVPADYDNDGKTDHAIYRPGSPNGIYWIYGSQTGFQVFPWGTSAHTVVRY